MSENIQTMDEYFVAYRDACIAMMGLLEPLHRPGIDPLPDYSRYLRPPMPAQADVIAGAVKMLDEVKCGIISGEMGCGKTLMGMQAIDVHAARSARKGGRNRKYRCVVLCPDHIITKWRDEIEATIPGAQVTIFASGPAKTRTVKSSVNSRSIEANDVAACATIGPSGPGTSRPMRRT
jgi:hypothetical protein